MFDDAPHGSAQRIATVTSAPAARVMLSVSMPGAKSSSPSLSGSVQGPIHPESPALPAAFTQRAPAATAWSTSAYSESP